MTVYEIQLELQGKIKEFKKRKISNRIVSSLSAAVSMLSTAQRMMEHENEKIESGMYG